VKAYTILFASIVVLWSCSDGQTNSKYASIAKAYCECTRELSVLNQRLIAMRMDTSARLDLEAVEREYQAAQSCVSTILTRHGRLTRDEQELLIPEIAVHCPDLSKQHELLSELIGQ
jgi:hypothetical protein